MLTTLDFHLRKHNENYQLDVYPRDKSQPLATATFDFPVSFLTGFELKQLDFDARNAVARVERLQAFGRKLYQKIFTPEVERVWKEHKQQNEFVILCIRIAPDANELESLPWETLHDGEEFIAVDTRTTVTRLPLDVLPVDAPPAVPLPLKMLALVSSPLDLPDQSRLQMEREQEILLEAINDPAGQGRLRADFEDEAKLEILEGSLDVPYQIFHFTGHGIAPESGGGLLLEDAQGRSRPTSTAEVLQSLQRGEKSLRLVVLSGCQTARTIHAAGFRDMARGLLRRKIPAVIAMQFSISDAGGLKFAEVLYPRITAGQPLELALNAARRALWLSDDYILKADALAPVLLTSNGECLRTTEAQKDTSTGIPEIDFSFYLPLPQLSYSFYGRRSEYRKIRDGILQRNQRAVIIHGIGGIGKTALVSHIAARLKKRFKGVYAFDCSSGTLTPETVLIKLHQFFAPLNVNALERLLYQSIPPETLANFLAQILSQWSLLLIFDNFETQLERTADGFQIADENLRTFITTLVKTTATNSHFLFTSRYLFNLDDKRLGNIQSLSLEDLSRPEALNLMQKLPHLSNAAYAEKLKTLETFGGHPYAFVTLDRYCNHRPLSQALEDAKSLHAELREFLAIELNYTRLSERSRELLNRFAAFRQAMPYEAAEWVMGEKVSYAAEFLEEIRDELTEEDRKLDDATLLQRLETELPERRQGEDITHQVKELIEWGLLTPIVEDGQLTELSIHALVRDFCHEKQPPDVWRIRLRDAAGFYTNFTKSIAKNDKTNASANSEMEAFGLYMEAEDFKDAALLIIKNDPFLERQGFGHYLEGQYRRLLGKVNRKDEGAIKIGLGTILHGRGNYDEAFQCFQDALIIAKEYDDKIKIGRIFHNLGVYFQTKGDNTTALTYYHQAINVKKEIGDEDGMPSTLGQIGNIHLIEEEYKEALTYYQQSLQLKENLKDHSGIARTKVNMGSAYRKLGNAEDALQQYEQALEIFEKIGDKKGIARVVFNIGDILYNKKIYQHALSYFLYGSHTKIRIPFRFELPFYLAKA